MTFRSIAKLMLAAATSLAVVFAAVSIKAPRVNADDDDTSSKIKIGFAIAPVPLNLAGRSKALVGYGSYIVNAVGDCNGCHTAGGPPNFNYAAGGNPYFNQPQVVDPTVYLSGGMDFGPVGTPTGPTSYPGPDIIARNLTPNKDGVPEGGMDLSKFKEIMRHGRDFDHIHPTCSPDQITEINNGATPVCIPTSTGNTADGDLLQVMPWPTFSHMTDKDIEAIYEYLSAIPCIDNTTSTPPDGAPNELRNDCGTGDAANKSVRDSSMHQGLPSHLSR
jgi:cytochrome c553